MFSSKRSRVIAAGIAAVVIAGGSYGIVDATSSSATTTASRQYHQQPASRRFHGGLPAVPEPEEAGPTPGPGRPRAARSAQPAA